MMDTEPERSQYLPEYQCRRCGWPTPADDAEMITADGRCLCRRCYQREADAPATRPPKGLLADLEGAMARGEAQEYTVAEGTDDFADFGYRRQWPTDEPPKEHE